MKEFAIHPSFTSIDEVMEAIQSNTKAILSDKAKEQITKVRKFLDAKLDSSNQPLYGVNTGFGALYNKKISKKDLNKLQENLVKSHACGTGQEVPTEIVKLMLLLKAKSMSFGNSAVQLETVERLLDFYNHEALPVVYEQGSLGASGDLAPLAHLCLPLIGLGEVNYRSQRIKGSSVLRKLKLKQVELVSKEGLALLNGTQFMQAFGVYCIHEAERLYKLANTIGAISLEAFDGRIEPFHSLIQTIRPHLGQIETALQFRELLKGSELISQKKQHVQDPYAFRCIPQVHGATFDTIRYVKSVFETEINSVTDNPTLFPDEDLLISAGNFHGQPLALTMDFLGIALAELGNISERRTYQLISGLRGLPSFLVANPGLNSGFMIPQYTAAGIVSQNKQLATPASVDSITSSAGQEDHVSMGANAATKCYKIVENIYTILAIELFTAAQAIEFRRPKKTSIKLEKILNAYRKEVPFIQEDTTMYPEIQRTIKFIKKVKI
ncbi:MAG: histidine ammonia-lyase [Bacteroidia bacterium]|nr:histidine ammonia-lyase [Bacteroidia bacterium]